MSSICNILIYNCIYIDIDYTNLSKKIEKQLMKISGCKTVTIDKNKGP